MSCSVHTNIPAGKPVPVSVNGIVIARDDIVREMQHHPAAKPIDAWQKAACALVIRQLLLQRAEIVGVVAKPISDEEGRRETEEESLMRAVVEREVAVPEPDEDICRRYYRNNLGRFRSPTIYEASHILFAALPADSDAYAQARTDAEAVLTELKENPESFAAMARSYSCCPSASQDGNLGQLTADQVTPEFSDALKEMSPGEILAKPVATRYGFHIIKLVRKHDGQTLPYEAVAGRITDYLRDSVAHRAQAQYVARLVSSAHIEGIALAGAAELRVY